MNPSDLYFRRGRLVGTVIKVEEIKAEFGLYKVVTYKPFDDWTAREYPERFDVYRLSDGPDLCLGGPNIRVSGLYSWTLTEGSIHLLSKANKITEVSGHWFTENEIIQNLIKISEEELKEAFELVQS